MTKNLSIGTTILSSRLFLGTAQYPSPEILRQAIEASRPGLITVSLRRENAAGKGQKFWDILKGFNIPVLPNTAGCHSVQEAVTTAEMAREVFNTNWIKLEVIGDDYTLQPDPYGLVEATQQLIKKGFEVFPYMTDDLVLAQKLTDAGCNILMPWGAPIGSGRGLNNPYALKVLRERFPDKLLVVDAGGDGIDVNGAFEMTDGVVLVNGPTQRMNGALDYDALFKLSGGFIVAAGSSGMAQTAGASSTQPALLLNFDTTMPAGTLFHIQSAEGEEILTFAPSKAYQSIAFSSPALVNGATYTVSYGGTSTGAATDGLYQDGTYGAGTEYTSFTVAAVVTTIGNTGRR